MCFRPTTTTKAYAMIELSPGEPLCPALRVLVEHRGTSPSGRLICWRSWRGTFFQRLRGRPQGRHRFADGGSNPGWMVIRLWQSQRARRWAIVRRMIGWPVVQQGSLVTSLNQFISSMVLSARNSKPLVFPFSIGEKAYNTFISMFAFQNVKKKLHSHSYDFSLAIFIFF